ncbi:2-oxoacid:acceptor oxidoreductase subunit alpha, partial [Candidatus Micrarchaeota archaeon]|nr:2-oxoacid:acceptor oxidoreductase subunit alpha [Candidatus Micrarchaeota archaeon]
ENTFQIRISDVPIHCPVKNNHLVVCLNKPTVDFHKDQVVQGGAMIFDAEDTKISPEELRSDIVLFNVPFMKLATENGGNIIMKNTVALGASIAVMGYDISILESMLSETFARKGPEIVAQNVKIAKAGYDYILTNYSAQVSAFPYKISKKDEIRRMVISGNEAIALGAAAGGLKFYSVYPMTPASSIMHYIANKELDFDILMKQTEDEIAAIHYAAGASFAGVRAATGTSGGGFALMAEAMSMVGMAETPVTIFLAQRTGPSTGMPTWTEQADLKFALNAGQGEFPRAIIAPGDMEEAFEHTAKALNIAEKYQLPVIVLTDKYLSESFFSCEKFDVGKIKVERGKIITQDMKDLPPNTRYKRYALTKDGISQRPIPGVLGGIHVASSYEHDETGFSTENFQIRVAMADKRMKKLNGIIKNEVEAPKLYGPEDAEVTLICWGSHKGIAIDAAKMLEKSGIKANVLHFIYLFPLDARSLKKTFKQLKKKVMIENNSTAQFAGILREYTGLRPDFKLLKYDARQFFPEEIVQEVQLMKERNWKGKKEIRVKDDFAFDYLQAKKVL